MVLMLRMVFHLALRQAEAFAGSVLRLWGSNCVFPITPRSADAVVILRGGVRM